MSNPIPLPLALPILVPTPDGIPERYAGDWSALDRLLTLTLPPWQQEAVARFAIRLLFELGEREKELARLYRELAQIYRLGE